MARVQNIPEFIKLFTEGKVKNHEKFRSYFVYEYGDLFVLQYTRTVIEHDWRRRVDEEIKTEEIIAYRFPDGSCICNANELQSAGHGTIYGKTDREGENELQKILQHYGAVPIPFTLFRESKLDVRDFSWILKPKAETVTVKRQKEVWGKDNKREIIVENIDRHFVGAAIFKIEDEIFFFDVDRQELSHGIFNAFITKLPKTVKTAEGAYALLMPDDVKKAISEGTDVKRQGEFFFVKVSDECPSVNPLTEEEMKILKYIPSKLGFLEYKEITENDISSPHRQFREDELTTPGRIAFNEEIKRYSDVLNKLRTKFPSRSGTLGKSSSASHTVTRYMEIDKTVYVSGVVQQSRREHADITLSGWYKVIANTGVFSWTITGRVD